MVSEELIQGWKGFTFTPGGHLFSAISTLSVQSE